MADITSIVTARELSELAKVRIPKRFWYSGFDNFAPRHPSQRAALAAVKSWLTLARKGQGPMMALVGAQGTGKSHLLYSAAHELLAPGVRGGVFVRRWYAFADELRYGRTVTTEAGGRLREAAEIRRDWWAAAVCLIDEVRATSGTSFDDSELARFACHAYDEERAVLITTNVNPLADVIGAAAASRFVQVVVEGPDARQVA